MKEYHKIAKKRYDKANAVKYPISGPDQGYSIVYTIYRKNDQDIIEFLQRLKDSKTKSFRAFALELMAEDADAPSIAALDVPRYLAAIKDDPNDSINKHLSRLIRQHMASEL